MTWTYDKLLTALRKKYSNFVQNNKFYKIKAALEQNKLLCHERYLVPSNKKSSKAKFYNPNVMFEFDRHYSPIVSRASPSPPP